MNARDYSLTLARAVQSDLTALPPHHADVVMMVDDEPIMTDLIESHLAEAGYDGFVACNDPTQAMSMLRRLKPGVLLLDLMMPRLSGFEILGMVRADPELAYTPVIVLTATNSPAAKLQALEVGATEFLTKPVDASELVLRLRNTLALKREQDRLANVDGPTGLPNRAAFLRMLQGMARRDAVEPLAVLHLQIEAAREMRETLGQAATDRLLHAVSRRLTHCVRHGALAQNCWDVLLDGESDGIARVGSDEFVLVLRQLGGPDDATRMAKVVLAEFAQPFTLDGLQVLATPCIGIAMLPEDGNDAERLLQYADQACSQARQQGRGRCAFFSPELNARSIERLTLGHQLGPGIEQGELRLFYQPKVDLRSGRITGAEALVRWQHPQLGLLAPTRFIGLAEESGLVVRLGDWVLREACRQCAEWARSGRQIDMAVNVSRAQLEDGARFVATARAALEEAGLPPERLCIELTESQLMGDAESTLALLQQIKALGVSVAIDDFGTGYSSLSYLKRFPVDELKVDRSFIMDLDAAAGDRERAILQTIVSLGHSLGMGIVAEGVETLAQLEAVKAAGCEVFQGFLFSKPVPAEEWNSVWTSAGRGSVGQ